MKKSPLKAAPLHNPGQSLDEEIQRLIDDDIGKYALFLIIPVVLAIMEWWRWYANILPNPIVYTGIALIVSPYCIWQLRKSRRQLKNLRLGRDGERAVGQYLEELRVKGYRVLHDIVGNGFNVDHVVFSPKGIFVVETKTISKPNKGEAQVLVSDEKLLLNGMSMERDPVVQAKAAAGWIKELLKESTGKDFPVKPVVVFPGWFVKGSRIDAWILNPKALPTYIENEKTDIKPEDVQLATYHVARYIRPNECHGNAEAYNFHQSNFIRLFGRFTITEENLS